MKPQITNHILLILLIITLILAAQVISSQQRTISSKDQALEEKEAEITYRINREGRIIAEKQAAEIKVRDLEKAYPELANTISKQMDIKLSKLKVALQAEFKAQGSGNSTINNTYYIDSLGVKHEWWQLNANDGYLDFTADVYDSLNAPYLYTYTDTITYGFSVKKKWLLGNQQLYGSGMLQNPYAKITNSTSVLINDFKDKRFGIGPYVGYGIGENGSSITLGVSVHYSLIRF